MGTVPIFQKTGTDHLSQASTQHAAARWLVMGSDAEYDRPMTIRYDEKIDALYLRLDDSQVVESENAD